MSRFGGRLRRRSAQRAGLGVSRAATATLILTLMLVASCATTQESSSRAGMPNWQLAPTYGTVTLSSGFEPDPYRQKLIAGGEIDLAEIGGHGCVAEAPDLDLEYTARNYELFIYVEREEADTLLLVNDPSGNWHFNDDEIGTRPGIRFPDPESGLYDIWVGTYDGGMVNATLVISEKDWR